MQHLSTFEDFIAALGYQISTQKMLRACVRDFLNWRTACPLTLSLSEIKAWQQHLEQRPSMRGGGLSARMVRHYLYALRLFYNHLEQSGQLKNNPMSAYPLPVVQANRRNILSLSEIARLYEVCERVEDRAMLHIYYGLGLRRSEGESLKMGDMDEAKSLIYVRSGKGGKMRAVPMSTRIREDLAQYKMSKLSNKDAPFLSNAKGRSLRGNAAGRRLKKLLEMADLSLEYSLHSLRHSIASHLLLSGLKMEEVRRFLGHNNLESTQIYLHHGLEELA